MAILKLQIVCDCFADSKEVRELKQDIKKTLRDAKLGFDIEAKELPVTVTGCDGFSETFIRAVVEFEVIVHPSRIIEAASELRRTLKFWDFGEEGGWHMSALIDYFALEQPLSLIEKMAFLSADVKECPKGASAPCGDEELPF